MKEEPTRHSFRNGLIIALGILILMIGYIVVRNISSHPQAVIFPPTSVGQTQGVASSPCAYVWASTDLTDLNEELRTLYESVNIPNFQVRASAFGENCLNEDGSIREFLTRQTDLTYSLEMDVSDQQAASDMIEKILEVLANVPESRFPGQTSGEVSIQFINVNGQIATVRGDRVELVSAYLEGKRGVDLLTLLGLPPEK